MNKRLGTIRDVRGDHGMKVCCDLLVLTQDIPCRAYVNINLLPVFCVINIDCWTRFDSIKCIFEFPNRIIAHVVFKDFVYVRFPPSYHVGMIGSNFPQRPNQRLLV